MKYWQIIVLILTVFFSGSGHSENQYDPGKLSVAGHDFLEKMIQIDCLRLEHIDDEKCEETPQAIKIRDELLNGKNGNRFLGHQDLANSFTNYPNKFEEYIQWSKKTPLKDWVELTKHPLTTIRYAAFQALVSAYPEYDFVPILIASINDDKRLDMSGYYRTRGSYYSDALFWLACTPNGLIEHSSGFNLTVKNFSEAQQQRLFKALLTIPNKLQATSDFLLQIEPRADFYPLIKKSTIKNNYDAGFNALAKFRKSEDVNLIINYMIVEWSFTDEFIQFIKHYTTEEQFFNIVSSSVDNVLAFRKRILMNFYDYFVESLDTQTLFTLKQIIINLSEEQRKVHQEVLFNTLSKNKASLQNALLWDFWINNNRINYQNYHQLVKSSPSKALELTKKNLSDIEQLSKDNRGFYWYNHIGLSDNKKLIQLMLNFAFEKDQHFATEFMKKWLVNPYSKPYPTYPIVVKKVIEIKDRQFATLLLDLLESSNPNIVREAVEALLSFDDKALRYKVVDSLTRNRHLRKHRNWERFYIELEKQGII